MRAVSSYDSPQIPSDEESRMPNDLLTKPVRIIEPLSSAAWNVISSNMMQGRTILTAGQALKTAIRESELLHSGSSMIFKVSEDLVVKISANDQDHTEFEALKFLGERGNRTTMELVPRQHGLLVSGNHRFIFTSYLLGERLSDAWNDLASPSQEEIANQIRSFYLALRRVYLASPRMLRRLRVRECLGGVSDQGCKAVVRGTIRKSQTPITDCADFIAFRLQEAGGQWPDLISALREESAAGPFERTAAFTHGSLRPSNILIDRGKLKVVGVVDWAMSGFYPLHWEDMTSAWPDGFGRDLSIWIEKYPIRMALEELLQKQAVRRD